MLPGTVNAFPSRGIAGEGFRSRAGADAGEGDTSSGNSARLKDACTGSELTTFFYTRKDLFDYFSIVERSSPISNLKMISISYPLDIWTRTCRENFLGDKKRF